MSDDARIAMNEDDEVEAHKKIAVNDEPTDEARVAEQDEDDEVEAHLKMR